MHALIAHTEYRTIKTPARYEHHLTGENNAGAHLKRMLLGHQVIVPVTNGKLDLGPWERVHYGEFDGCRDKRILLKALGTAQEGRTSDA